MNIDGVQIFVWKEDQILFSIFVPQQTGGIHLSGDARWEQSTQELKSGLISLVDGRRVPLPSPTDDDPLAEIKRI